MISLERRRPDDLQSHYHGYVEAAPGTTLLESLTHPDAGFSSLAGIDPAPGDHRYAPGKWTIKEVVQHVIDSERVFAYRALRFARNDATPLPGFEQDDYVPASESWRRSMSDLLEEAATVRASLIALYRSFTPAMLARRGIASDRPVTVHALGWIAAGHAAHHLRIIEQRYL